MGGGGGGVADDSWSVGGSGGKLGSVWGSVRGGSPDRQEIAGEGRRGVHH